MSAASFRRSQVFRNPDEDFVLHGRSASYWEKPTYLNNSQIENSSARLSQHTMFNPEMYKDRHYVKSLTDIANNLGNLSDNLNRSVSFSNKLQSKQISNNSLADYRNTDRDLYQLRAQSSDLTFGTRSASAGALMSPRVMPGFASRTRSGEIDDDDVYTRTEKMEYPLTTSDSLSLRYFPVTMSAPYELTYLDMNVPSAKKHNIRPKSAPRLTSMASTSKSNLKQFTRGDVDKMFLMSSEAPVTGSSSKVITSPYQSEIARLRMERLRLEEDRILEIKRLEEIEKIRGPNPKWYESKGLEFHYECGKNTEMMKHENHWEDLVNYRNHLLECSPADFRKSEYETLA